LPPPSAATGMNGGAPIVSASGPESFSSSICTESNLSGCGGNQTNICVETPAGYPFQLIRPCFRQSWRQVR
jgi:hypothetical protein